jgi:SNF2 family DNA or RNA helicase
MPNVAHRIGQTRPVMIYRLVARDTVEERVLALQKHKRGLAEAAIGGQGGPPLSREEMLELLG